MCTNSLQTETGIAGESLPKSGPHIGNCKNAAKDLRDAEAGAIPAR